MWLIASGFPEGFQTLCAKHNNDKGSMTDEEYRASLAMAA
jgi:hypothetical protein